jgi:ribosomal-protein-alanine N-acetyltransferase
MTDNNEIRIEAASWLDLGAVHQLEKACFGEHAWPLIDLLGVLTLPGLVRLKAMQGEELVGFVGGERKPTQGAGWITTIGVLPQYRRSGIATVLLDACEQALGYPLIRLCVHVNNEQAINLYRKLGYQKVDLWPRYYANQEDAYVFEKRVDFKDESG